MDAQMQEEAKAALQHAADTMKLYYNQNHCATPKYQLGDWVWLNMHNYTTDHPTKKLDHKWAGPYQIEKKLCPQLLSNLNSLVKRKVFILSYPSLTYTPTPLMKSWNALLPHTHTPLSSIAIHSFKSRLSS